MNSITSNLTWKGIICIESGTGTNNLSFTKISTTLDGKIAYGKL
jgi:hypothetical protein